MIHSTSKFRVALLDNETGLEDTSRKMNTALYTGRQKLFLCGILFITAFYARFCDISYRSLWMDEDFQAQTSALGVFNPLIAKGAFLQDQPPIDYYLQAMGIVCFGYNEVGIRIHAVLAGALASVLFFILVARHYNVWSALVGYVLFAFNPWLLRYSVEARPYSTGILFSVIFIVGFHSFFRSDRLRNFLLFTLSQFLFLCAIGFQSILLIGCFCLASLFSLSVFETLRKKRKVFAAVASTVLSVILFSPVYYQLLQKLSRKPGRTYPFSTWLERFPVLLQQYTVHDFFSFITMAGEGMYLLAIAVIATSVLLLRHKRLGVDSAGVKIRMTLLVVLFLFPLACWFAWFLLMRDWGFDNKYKLVYLPVIFLVIAIGSNDLLVVVKGVLDQKIRRVIVSLLGIAVMALCANYIVNAHIRSRPLASHEHLWRELFTSMKAHVKPGDVMIIESLTNSGLPAHWFAQQAYFKEEMKTVPLLTTESPQLVEKLRKINQYHIPHQNIYFTFYLDGEYRDIVRNEASFKGEGFKFFDAGGLTTIRYADDSKDLLEKVIFFFEYVLHLVPEKKPTIRLLRQLAELHLFRGNIAKSIFYLEKLVVLDKENKTRMFEAFEKEYLRELIQLQLQRNQKRN